MGLISNVLESPQCFMPVSLSAKTVVSRLFTRQIICREKQNDPTTISRLSKVRIALPVVLAVNEKQENEQSVLTHNYIFAYKF